jgi:hypothetical protein
MSRMDMTKHNNGVTYLISFRVHDGTNLVGARCTKLCRNDVSSDGENHCSVNQMSDADLVHG